MKLLLIRMVANKVLGVSRRFKILLEVVLFSAFRFSKSLGESEKKATSEPEIKAEKISKINTNRLAIIRLKLETSSKRKGMKFKAKSSRSSSASNIVSFVLMKQPLGVYGKS